MILHEVLYVTPSSPRILMLDRFKDEDPELIAQVQAQNFPEAIYFVAELIIENAKEDENWPDIKWTNWYGKVVSDNTFAFYPLHNGSRGLAEKIMLTEAEVKWFLNSHPSSILFIYEEEL